MKSLPCRVSTRRLWSARKDAPSSARTSAGRARILATAKSRSRSRTRRRTDTRLSLSARTQKEESASLLVPKRLLTSATAHFGCVVKEGAKADGKTLFATFDECATQCHRVPDKMSFGCAGTRPNSCVLVDHEPDETEHYFAGFDECSAWCKATPSVELII